MKVVRWAIIIVIILTSLLIPSTTATAAWDPGCGSRTAKFEVIATNLHLQVATMHRQQTRCWDTHGYLTSTKTTTWFVNTSGGSLFGVDIDTGGPFRTYRDEGMHQWKQDYTMRACFAKWTLFCGATMDFRTVTTIMAPRFDGWQWTRPFCTSSACEDRVEFKRVT